MSIDSAKTGSLRPLLSRVGAGFDEYLKFERPDALHPDRRWREQLAISLPRSGIGIDGVAEELVRHELSRDGKARLNTTGLRLNESTA